MNIQPVSAPPDFWYTCFGCGRRYLTANMDTYADLDGPAFKAYYCFGCNPVHWKELNEELNRDRTFNRNGG
jgi:hypothetical protein